MSASVANKLSGLPCWPTDAQGALLTRAGHYTYGLFLKQDSGAPGIRFGTTRNGAFTPLPRIQASCPGNPNSRTASQFQLDGNRFAASFDLAYGVQGQLSFAGASGTPAPTPTAFTEDCAGAPPGPQPPQPDEDDGRDDSRDSGRQPTAPDERDIQDLIDAIAEIELPAQGEVPAQEVEAIAAVLTDANELGEEIAASLQDGTAETETGLDFLTAATDALDLACTAIARGSDGLGAADIVSGLNTIEAVILALGADLSPRDLNQLRAVVIDNADCATRVASAADMATDTAADIAADTDSLIEALAAVVNAALAAGVALDADLLAALQALTETAIESALPSIADGLSLEVTFEDAATTRTLLSANPQLLQAVLDTASVSLNSRIDLDREAAAAALRNAGLNPEAAAALIVAQAVIVFSAVYWFPRIESVRALLRLAYG